MIGVLIGNDIKDEGGRRGIFLGQARRERMEMVDKPDLALRSKLDHRRHGTRVVERAGRNRDAVWSFIGQRRAAVAAEAALDMVGRTKSLRRPARPFQHRAAHGDERCIVCAKRLLAHAAMTDR
jgi:hypothetical protein